MKKDKPTTFNMSMCQKETIFVNREKIRKVIKESEKQKKMFYNYMYIVYV